MKKLYNSRERNGDVIFLIKTQTEDNQIEVPVPENQPAAASGQNDVEMRNEEQKETRIKCHRQVLLAQSEYFQGYLQFNNMAVENGENNEGNQETVLTVREYSQAVVQAMIDFIYLGSAKINSNDLVDLLGLCQEYLLVNMQQAIEHVFAEQLTVDLFLDIYMLTRAYDCNRLKDSVVSFAVANYQALRQKGLLVQMDRDDQLLVSKALKASKAN